MQIFRELDCIPKNFSTVLSVGMFDGVHLGHQQIIGDIIARSRELRVSSAVVTCDPHPCQVLAKSAPVRIPTPLPIKLRLFEHMGINAVIVLRFTTEFAAISRVAPEGRTTGTVAKLHR